MHDRRKLEHLEICLQEDVRSAASIGLERYRLIHQCLPEMALGDVQTSTRFLGQKLRAPLLLSSMTGGTDLAAEVNRRLATAAQELGLAMGLGSQRAGIEDPELMATYQVRDRAPDILLLANLGAVQLNYGYGVQECLRAVESVGADGLILHLNPLQEALQPEGNTDFSGLLAKIERVCRELPVPVVVKEVGWGLSPQAAEQLCRAGVAALDIAGAGGTSWSEVERHRSGESVAAEVASAFASWGIPTADSLVWVRRTLPDLPLIASGGLTNGVEAALCLALGANLVGMAQPLLPPAMESAQAVIARLEIVIRQLRVAMFCSGARNMGELDRSRVTTRS
ncbi:MAG TPA: type 2 isopentenyl-diphosphate Delta-isomerase [Anaerolineae bacterium]|nr:type 2 isopentenyl-diphosphate Delta-isomerase [Anaerolineae bacterium]